MIEVIYYNKIVSIVLLIILTLITTVKSKTITSAQIFVGYLFLLSAVPLGHDTLQYYINFQSGFISNYSIIWNLMNKLPNFFLMYIIVFFIIIYSFAKLVRGYHYSSLLFYILIITPSLGLEYTSILRQGLATAFVVLLFLNRSRITLFAMALLSHSSGASSFIILNNKIKFGLLFITPLILFTDIGNSYLIEVYERLTYLVVHYLINVQNSITSGRFLFAYWSIILSMFCMMSFRIFSKRKSILCLYLVLTTWMLYFILFNIEPVSVRIIWMFLPILLLKISHLVQPYKLNWIFISSMSFTMAFVHILNAKGYYWLGKYEI